MSSEVNTGLKKVSSSDSIFKGDNSYNIKEMFTIFEKCKEMKNANEIIKLLDELKTNLENTEDKSIYELDFFYNFDSLFFLFSKKEKHIMSSLYDLAKIFIKNCHEWAIPNIIETLIYGISQSNKRGDEVRNTRKEYSLKMISVITGLYPHHIKNSLFDLVSPISSLTSDLTNEVKKASTKALEKIIACNGNNDLTPFLPIVFNFLSGKSKIENIIEELAGCVFVQDVELPALSIIEPIITEALKFRKNEVQRKACVIIDNMCKLVEKPQEIVPIITKIKPLLEKCVDTISNPEARNMAEKSLQTLVKSCKQQETMDVKLLKKDTNDIINLFKEKIEGEITVDELKHPLNEMVNEFNYGCILLKNLSNGKNFELEIWQQLFEKYVHFVEASEVLEHVYNQCKVTFEVKEEIFEDTEEGKDLYKGAFSLAYGALTLLNNTHLHLKRNRFYGLLGPNNCGKTTLMRAIANEQIEGFPKRDELKTIFVEHEIQEREVGEDKEGYPIFNIDLCGTEWVVDCCNEVYKMEPKVTREQVEKVMEDIGFGNSSKGTGKDRAADASMGVTTYSGGWKMKMQLCAATLMNTDILMLDEPTGHLDVKNIAWIKQWLKDYISGGGSVITTSHDSSFLDEMCSHIIDFQDRKLKIFRGQDGNVLKQFVEKYPEKQGYFELKNDVMKFTFPNPGYIEGVKSKGVPLLSMTDVYYKYPIRDTPTVFGINLKCTRSTRSAVIGPNGAGKSTAIKLLIGELEPTSGEVKKHPSLRMAYVAQHAFQHLEKHIKETPVQYILDRFAGNDDKENVDFKKNRKIDEVTVVNKYFLRTNPDTMLPEVKKCFGEDEEKKAVTPEKILARKENKKEKTKEYEVKWKSLDNQTTWVTREILVDMGALLMVQRQDEKEAIAAGLMDKPLTSTGVEKHLQNFGIDPEQASHTLIGSLSGGQKVKVVLAASMWQNPHIVILDEPTNYLDRDGLGALTKAIEEFDGGVIIITHNREFANAVAQEKWIMEAGHLRREGESVVKEEKQEGNSDIGDNTIVDAQGNEIKVQKQKDLSDKEKKQKIKILQKKIKAGKKSKTLTDQDIWDIEDEIAKLKE